MSVEQDNEKLNSDQQIPPHIYDIIHRVPHDWEDPRTKTFRLLVEQSGILPQMERKNPGFSNRVNDFLVGDKNILIVGGESGMGKSLLAAEIRQLHADLRHVLPIEKQNDIAVISWDRTHKAFYEEASTSAGETIPLPKGETPVDGRRIVSGVLADQIQFTRKYIGRRTRILVEAPLIDQRGETIFDELAMCRDNIQTFVMHSPESRQETLEQGRLMETSGQRDAMESMRSKLIQRILGRINIPLSLGEQDEIIKRWWQDQLPQWGGMIVSWDPHEDKDRFQETIRRYQANGLKPDVLAPRALSYATRNQFESIFRAIPDIDTFLRDLTS